jgi:hypothetical protein
MAIFPFIRQFFNVDLKCFDEASYINLKKWVEEDKYLRFIYSDNEEADNLNGSFFSSL